MLWESAVLLRQSFDIWLGFRCFGDLELVQKSVRGHALVAVYVLMVRHLLVNSVCDSLLQKYGVNSHSNSFFPP